MLAADNLPAPVPNVDPDTGGEIASANFGFVIFAPNVAPANNNLAAYRNFLLDNLIGVKDLCMAAGDTNIFNGLLKERTAAGPANPQGLLTVVFGAVRMRGPHRLKGDSAPFSAAQGIHQRYCALRPVARWGAGAKFATFRHGPSGGGRGLEARIQRGVDEWRIVTYAHTFTHLSTLKPIQTARCTTDWLTTAIIGEEIDVVNDRAPGWTRCLEEMEKLLQPIEAFHNPITAGSAEERFESWVTPSLEFLGTTRLDLYLNNVNKWKERKRVMWDDHIYKPRLEDLLKLGVATPVRLRNVLRNSNQQFKRALEEAIAECCAYNVSPQLKRSKK